VEGDEQWVARHLEISRIKSEALFLVKRIAEPGRRAELSMKLRRRARAASLLGICGSSLRAIGAINAPVTTDHSRIWASCD